MKPMIGLKWFLQLYQNPLRNGTRCISHAIYELTLYSTLDSFLLLTTNKNFYAYAESTGCILVCFGKNVFLFFRFNPLLLMKNGATIINN